MVRDSVGHLCGRTACSHFGLLILLPRGDVLDETRQTFALIAVLSRRYPGRNVRRLNGLSEIAKHSGPSLVGVAGTVSPEAVPESRPDFLPFNSGDEHSIEPENSALCLASKNTQRKRKKPGRYRPGFLFQIGVSRLECAVNAQGVRLTCRFHEAALLDEQQDRQPGSSSDRQQRRLHQHLHRSNRHGSPLCR